MNDHPESELVSEDELRAALRFHKINAAVFEAGIHARIQRVEAELAGDPRTADPLAADAFASDPLARAPQLLRVAAAVLPLPIITGGKGTALAVPLARASTLNKLLGYVAMPAMSLFVLPAAAIFAAARIRNLQRENILDVTDHQAILNATALWARRHKWFLHGLLWGTLALAWIGATSLMLLLYLISLGVLLYVLSSFVKLGVANRQVIGQSCLMGLMFLGQISMFAGIGDQDIHFVDPQIIAAVFFGGVLVLLPLVMGSLDPLARPPRLKGNPRWVVGGLIVGGFVSMIGWLMSPILWPATSQRIKSHVESFDKAPSSSVSWRQWEIVASWAIDSKLDPDLSHPRRLLAAEIAGEQNPYVLASAMRVGLVRVDQLGQLRNYDARRQALVDDTVQASDARPILSLTQEDWVIRAAVLRNDLTPSQRDHLEQRLHATLEELAESQHDVLETAMRATQLLEVIQRPVDRAQYRDMVHGWLRKFHSKKGAGFQVAGGFRQYLREPEGFVERFLWSPVGSVDVTSYAVELMRIYGIPDGLDLNWVRSFLRPRSLNALNEEKWMTAVTLDRLNLVPGVEHPSWLSMVYYERSLIMAALLVSLCIYATLSSARLAAADRQRPGCGRPTADIPLPP